MHCLCGLVGARIELSNLTEGNKSSCKYGSLVAPSSEFLVHLHRSMLHLPLPTCIENLWNFCPSGMHSSTGTACFIYVCQKNSKITEQVLSQLQRSTGGAMVAVGVASSLGLHWSWFPFGWMWALKHGMGAGSQGLRHHPFQGDGCRRAQQGHHPDMHVQIPNADPWQPCRVVDPCKSSVTSPHQLQHPDQATCTNDTQTLSTTRHFKQA